MCKNVKKEKGYTILSLLLAVVGFMVVIGVWALSGWANTSSSTANGRTNIYYMQAMSILNDADTISAEYNRLVLTGSNPNNITFLPNVASTAISANIFDPVSGVNYPTVDPASMLAGSTNPDRMWIYNPSNFFGKNVGTDAGADSVILLTGIKTQVCLKINSYLYGVGTFGQNFATSSAQAVSDATPTVPISNKTINLSTQSTMVGWKRGCMTIAGAVDNGIYFQVLKES